MLRQSAIRSPQAGPARLERNAYLAHVDGLRAISILAVVGFHVGLPGVSGGYVGVDVFFVISGFLIVNQIRTNLEDNRFSILDFYARRALRILPPYALMLLAVFLAAPFVLPAPTIYYEFFRQAAIAPLMISNFLFYRMTGYFDLLADEKPLLHTWTLAVEEQFYLVAPLLLLLVFWAGRRQFGKTAFLVAVVLAALSFAGAVAFTDMQGRNAAFYFPHWRAWEFIAGGLIGKEAAALAARLPRAVLSAIGLAGFACIAMAVATFDTMTPFPSWRASLPVGGAALIILSGLADPRNLMARVLSLRWLVAIGLVSYGWYLWHWPILSFMRIVRLGEPSLIPDLLGGGALALGLAFLSYRYLEQPIRQWRRSRGKVVWPGRIVAAGVAGCLAMALLGAASGYAGYRINGSYVAARYGTEGAGTLDNGCVIFRASDFHDFCLEGRFGLLIGDSHAHALAPSFTRSFERIGVKLVSLTRPGCQPNLFAPEQRKRHPHGCSSMLAPFERIVAQPGLAFVIFASIWPYEIDPKELSALIAQFDPSRTRVLVMGRGPVFNHSSLDCVVLSDRYAKDRDRCVATNTAANTAYRPRDAVLRNVVAGFPNTRYVDPSEAFCTAGNCKPFDGDRVFFRDTGHVLPSGAERIFAAFKGDMTWLAQKR